MKPAVLLLMLLLGETGSLAAQIVRVVEQSTQQPIEGVAFTSASPLVSAVSDAKGQVNLSGFMGSDVITVTHMSYRAVTLSHAEAVAAGVIRLAERAYNLDAFVTSASRFEERRRDVPEHIATIRQRDIAFLDQQTTPDLLQNSGALFVQRSQMGGGSPVIRGFEASRVLLVVDGVRMNNAIYRAGHLQDLMTVDQNAIERIEVISGPGSVAFGSDALGGVVHLITRQSRFIDTSGVKASGGAFVRASTANNERTASATVELRARRITSLTTITASDFGDLRQGSVRNPFYDSFGSKPFIVETTDGVDAVRPNPDPDVQAPTAYKQIDALQKLRLRSGPRATHQINLQLSTSTDVPRYDRLSEYALDTAGSIVPVQAEWHYGPQKRMLAAYTLELKRERGLFGLARITPSYQHIEQSRRTRGFGSSRRGINEERVGVAGLNADFEKRQGRHELRYGLEYYANTVRSEAYREHIRTGEITYRTTRYPNGGSTMNLMAAYLSHTMEVNERLVVSEGLRFSLVDLVATFADERGFQFLNGTYAQRSDALNWRLGLVYAPGREWRFNALASTGFRAPNVDDMGKVFDSVRGTVIVPNTGLKPESTTNFELGLGKTFDERYTVEATGFHTHYTNALVVGDFTVNGQDSIDFDGTPSRVTALTNKREASLYGAQGQVVLAFNDRFTFRSGLTWTYGRIRTDSTDHPLDHIPPVYGRTGLEWRAKRLRAEAYLLYNGWKRLRDYNRAPGGEDNLQYATAEGMPAWVTLNARASFAITGSLSLQLGLENILDTNYRTFASGVSAPGRNLQASLRASW